MIIFFIIAHVRLIVKTNHLVIKEEDNGLLPAHMGTERGS